MLLTSISPLLILILILIISFRLIANVVLGNTVKNIQY